MDAKTLALFYLRFTDSVALNFLKRQDNTYLYEHRITFCWEGNRVYTAFYDDKTEILPHPLETSYSLPAVKNIKDPVAFVEKEWLEMPYSSFDKLTKHALWYYTLLFPYLIQKPQVHTKVEIKHKKRLIKIENLADLVALYAFFPPFPNKVIQDNEYYRVVFTCPKEPNFSSFAHYKLNKTIYRSFITFALVKNVLKLFKSPNYAAYSLKIPKTILHEFAFFKGENLSCEEVYWIFRDIRQYKLGVGNHDYEEEKFEQRLLVDNFILL